MSTRYERQMILPEVGMEGQARLAKARVLVIGAGGLGCPVLEYLAGAGVGHLTIVDPDHIEVTNLHRQPLYSMADIGLFKAERAAQLMRALNPDISLTALVSQLDPSNVDALVSDADIVVDAADSFAATYTLSDSCANLGRPLVSASVLGMSGYAGVFCGSAPSYRAVFPDLPEQAQTCSSAGVLGPAVAMLGALQAQLVMALILQLQPSPHGRLVTVDLGSFSFGGFSFTDAPEPQNPVIRFISTHDITPTDQVVELRSKAEAPTPPHPNAMRIDIEGLATWQPAPNNRIVVCCRSGLRAWRAAQQLQNRGFTNIALLAAGE